MKCYKLLKDLPTIKAGATFKLDDKVGLVLLKGDRDTYGPFIPGVFVLYDKPILDICPNILKDWFEEIPEEPKTVLDLRDGEECWMVGCCELGYTPVRLKFGKLAEVLRLTGSLYLTKGEAEKDIAWNMAQEILRRDTKGFKPKWPRSFADAPAQNFTVVYDCHSGLLLPHMATTAHHAGDIYFATEDDARASIKAHPNEWKTYLGVGE